MSKQQIAKLEQQLKVLPPGSAAAKALRAAIMQAQATLKAAAPPPAPQELAPSVIPEIIPAIPPSIVSTATGLSPVPAPPLTSVEIPETPVVMPSTTPEKPHIYQAVGIIQAELQRNQTGHYCLQWREKTWPVRPLQRMWKILPQRLEQLLYWRVYPQSYFDRTRFHRRSFCHCWTADRSEARGRTISSRRLLAITGCLAKQGNARPLLQRLSQPHPRHAS
jgi:hypothetical protein